MLGFGLGLALNEAMPFYENWWNSPHWWEMGGNATGDNVCYAQRGKQNKNNEYQGYSDEELEKLYKDPSVSKKEKQKIKEQQKANKKRNQQRRKSRGY